MRNKKTSVFVSKLASCASNPQRFTRSWASADKQDGEKPEVHEAKPAEKVGPEYRMALHCVLARPLADLPRFHDRDPRRTWQAKKDSKKGKKGKRGDDSDEDDSAGMC